MRDETGHRDHFAEQPQAAPRVVMPRDALERAGKFGIVREARRAVGEPAIERRFAGRDVGGELGMKPGRIADQVAGVNLEEAREQLPRLVGQMFPRSLFDERQIRLADRLTELRADRANQLRLRQLATEPAKIPFELTELAKLLAQSHFNL